MVPAGPAVPQADTAAPDSSAAQALFREARQRRRRRWQAGVAASLAASAAVAVSAVTWLPGITGHVKGGGRPSVTAPAVRSSAAAVWLDDIGRLHVGDIGPGARASQHVVAQVNASLLPLASARGRVCRVDPAGAFVPALGHWSQVVRYLDVSTSPCGTRRAARSGSPAAAGGDRCLHAAGWRSSTWRPEPCAWPAGQSSFSGRTSTGPDGCRTGGISSSAPE